MKEFAIRIESQLQEKLVSLGWDKEETLRDYIVQSKGRIWRADFLLLHRLNPLAIIEILPTERMQLSDDEQRQILGERSLQAHVNDIPFVFFTDGKVVLESDAESMELKERSTLPTPEELWSRLRTNENLFSPDPRLEMAIPGPFSRSPLAHQVFAVSHTLDSLLKGHKSVLVLMATGSGVSWVQQQLAWKLLHSSYRHRLLFLSDQGSMLQHHCTQIASLFQQEAKIDELDRFVQWVKDAPPEEKTAFRVYGAILPPLGSAAALAKLTHRFNDLPRDLFDLVFVQSGEVQANSLFQEVSKSFSNSQTIGFFPSRDRESIDRPLGTPVFEYSLDEAIAAEEPKAPPGYKALRLADITDFRTGIFIKNNLLQNPDLANPPQRQVAVPVDSALVVSARDIRSHGTLSLAQTRRIPLSSLRGALSLRTDASGGLDARYMLQPDDILLVAQGRIGLVALVPTSLQEPVVLASSLIRLRINPDVAARDVYAFLKSDIGQAALNRLSLRGTSIPRLTVGALEHLQVFLPELARGSAGAGSDNGPISRDLTSTTHEHESVTTIGDIVPEAIISSNNIGTEKEETQDPQFTAASAAHRRITEDIIPLLGSTDGDWRIIEADPDNFALAASLLHEVANSLSPPSLSEQVINDYPAPIALAYKRFLDSRFNPFEQVPRLKDLAEATSFFIYNVLLADALHNLDNKIYFIEDPGARRAYNGYSMAARLDFVAATLKSAEHTGGSELFVPELSTVPEIVDIARSLQEDLRNRISHTAAASESQQMRLIEEFQPKVNNLLRKLEFLKNYRLVRVPSFYYRKGQLIRQMIVYKGTTPTMDELPIETASLTPMERDHLILLNTDDQVLDLYPIYQLFSGEETRYETHLCFMKQRKKNREALEGESVTGAFAVNLEGFTHFEILQNRLLDKI